jgi:Domain of unknown function (DUF4168)
MPNLSHLISETRMSQVLLKFVVITTLSVVNVVSGVCAPPLALPSSLAWAQAFSDQEINSYAKAVLEIERVRQIAFDEMKRNAPPDRFPSMVCNQPGGLDQLSGGARKIFVQYCKESKAIVENHGLSASRFNQITLSLPSNPDLQKRIRGELLRLQR